MKTGSVALLCARRCRGAHGDRRGGRVDVEKRDAAWTFEARSSGRRTPRYRLAQVFRTTVGYGELGIARRA